MRKVCDTPYKMYGSDITMSSATPSAAALRTPAPKQKKTRLRNRLDDEPRYYANTVGGGYGVAKVQSRFARKINDWGRRRRKAMKARRAQGNMNFSRDAAAAAQQQSLGGRSVQRPGTAGLATSTICSKLLRHKLQTIWTTTLARYF